MESKIEVRNPTTSDVPALHRLREMYNNDGFELPPLSEIFSDKVVVVDGKVVAYGVLKMLAEAILIMDHSMPQKVKVQALTLLIQEATKVAAEKRIKEVIAHCEPKFSAVMKKQFGFEQLAGETITIKI